MNCSIVGGGNGGGSGLSGNNATGRHSSLPLPLGASHRCDVCGKLLSTKLTLKRHKEQQHLQPLNNAVCNQCHKVFRTLNSLNNHKSIYHRREKRHHHHHSHSHSHQHDRQQQQQQQPPQSHLHHSNIIQNITSSSSHNLITSSTQSQSDLSPQHHSQQQLHPNTVNKPCIDFL